MQNCGINKLIFSSSATVYGRSQCLPLAEDSPLAATNLYGRSKLIIEDMLRDQNRANPNWYTIILRYFNPVGAHESGVIGEDPRGTPNNLMPFIAQVALGHRTKLNIWGIDYPTHDGTGVRDYIHVVDLAIAHAKALEYVDSAQCTAINLGRGEGYSVFDVIRAFEEVSGQPVPYEICARRDGDVAICYADPTLAEKILGWRADRDLLSMCRDHWRWQKSNPRGYMQTIA